MAGDRTAFFYGTLMAPGVLYRVIYGTPTPNFPESDLPKVRPALLTGYRRSRVKQAEYPAIRLCPASTVRGSLVTGLTNNNIRSLDIFEGDMYTRKKVKTQLLRDAEPESEPKLKSKFDEKAETKSVVDELVDAETYVWRTDLNDFLEEDEWDFEEFKKEKMRYWMGSGFDENGESEEEKGEKVKVDEGFADADRLAEKEGWNQDPMGGRGANGAITKELEESRKG